MAVNQTGNTVAAPAEPNTLRYRIARWVIAHRGLMAALFVLVTLGFAAGLPRLSIKSIFSDLLPADDPFVQVFKDHPNFGNPLTVTVMIKNTSGDIYNHETLSKVWAFTRDLDLVPGINHDSLISIATEKARYAEATPYGVDMRPIMEDSVPTDPAEIQDFRRRVEQSPNVRTFYVSRDETATLVTAAFLENLLDYGVIFEQVQALAEQYRDEHHEVYVVGQPILTGWVYQLQNQTYLIFGVTLLALALMLALYMRNLAGTLTPIICSTVAAIWGFGLVAWLQLPVEPLLMIVPLLLVARSFSHCVQFSERFYEIYAQLGIKRKAAEVTMAAMMTPSILGVITDALGIFFIAVAPIPAMQRFALFCGFWALWIVPTGVFLISIVLSYLPAPRNIGRLVAENDSGFHAAQKRVLARVAALSYGVRAKTTSIVVLLFAAAAVLLSFQIKIGNPVEGSNLLWEDSDFNTAIRAINAHFPGVNTLELIIEAKTDDMGSRVARTADVVAASLML
jgi:predicted RND superfamily exporter protein